MKITWKTREQWNKHEVKITKYRHKIGGFYNKKGSKLSSVIASIGKSIQNCAAALSERLGS